MSRRKSDPLAELFSPEGPGTVRLGPDTDVAGLQEKAARLGWRCAVLDGPKMTDKRGMLEELSHSLTFPDYFGWNWDALEECLNDPAVMGDPAGWLLILRGADEAERHAPEDFKALISVLTDASSSRREQDPAPAFKTVLL